MERSYYVRVLLSLLVHISSAGALCMRSSVGLYKPSGRTIYSCRRVRVREMNTEKTTDRCCSPHVLFLLFSMFSNLSIFNGLHSQSQVDRLETIYLFKMVFFIR